MTKTRKRYSAEFKAKVALEAHKGMTTVNEIGSRFGLNPTQVSQWKKHLSLEAKQAFLSKSSKTEEAMKAEMNRLYEQIGRLNMELDWLKKTANRCH